MPKGFLIASIIVHIYFFPYFGSFVYWHINLYELSNTKIIFVVEQQCYDLTHS